MSKVTWTIKTKSPAGWECIPLAEINGRTLGEALAGFVGRDVVAEFIIGGGRHYFCGTEDLKKRMLKKGKAVLFSEAVIMLGSIHPELLAEICNYSPGIAEEFPGSTLGAVETIIPEPHHEKLL